MARETASLKRVRGRRWSRSSSWAVQKRAAEPGGTKPPHGVGALLDAPVVLFNPVVHVAAGPMAHSRAEGLAHRAGVGVVTVGGHLLGRLPHCLQGASKEPLILPISYKDDRRRAEEILLEVANRHTVPISEMGTEALDAMQRRYNVHPADVEPKVYYRLTDNWLELTVRFVVKEHGIRDITDTMSRDILAALETAGIGIASAGSVRFQYVGSGGCVCSGILILEQDRCVRRRTNAVPQLRCP